MDGIFLGPQETNPVLKTHVHGIPIETDNAT